MTADQDPLTPNAVLEQDLLAALQSTHFRPPAAASQFPEPDDLLSGTIAAVALDTNAIKQLAWDSNFADVLESFFSARGITIILPGQAVIEFWNNYQMFAEKDAQQLQNEVGKLTSLINRVDDLQLAQEQLQQIRELAGDLTKIVEQAASAESMEKAKNVVQLLSAKAIQPMVSRSAFLQLAEARQRAKNPPGFADEGRKVLTLGDFYVWADFLLGVRSMQIADDTRVLLITDDSKSDWKSGGSAHPELTYELHRITGARLTIADFKALRAAVTRQTRPRSRPAGLGTGT